MNTIAAIFETLAARPAIRRRLDGGEMLFHAGDPVRAVYVIETGRMRLVRPSIAGGEVTLHRAGAGESFAEPSLFVEHYHCDAMAETASTLLAYPKAGVVRALTRDPDLTAALLHHFAGQVQSLRSRAAILSLRAATDRLMTWFRLHMPAGGNTLRMDQTWKQLATEIGLTHEALYRALARLEHEGLIQRDGSTVRLPEQR